MRDESASRAGSDAEKPIQISMSSTKKEYKIWHLRFTASVRRRDPSLLHGSHSSRPDEAPSDSDSALNFSALLLPWLSDSVIEHFLAAGLDLSRQGADLLRSLERHFADSAPADDSPIEVLSAALRVQRRHFSTLLRVSSCAICQPLWTTLRTTAPRACWPTPCTPLA